MTFTWSPGTNATAYWLDVGYSLGQGDISAGKLPSTTLSKTVSGIPTDGRTIWVRLWTEVNGSFPGNNIDYSFTAAHAASAALLVPAAADAPGEPAFGQAAGGRSAPPAMGSGGWN